MPAFKKGESRQDWMNRCIPVVMKESGKDANAAGGQCSGMWDSRHKKMARELGGK